MVRGEASSSSLFHLRKLLSTEKKSLISLTFIYVTREWLFEFLENNGIDIIVHTLRQFEFGTYVLASILLFNC